MTQNTPSSEVQAVTLSGFLKILWSQKMILGVCLGAAAVAAIAVSYSYPPGCSASCTVAVGKMAEDLPIQQKEAAAAWLMSEVFPGLTFFQSEHVRPADLKLWGKTSSAFPLKPDLVLISGRATSYMAAEALAKAASAKLLDAHAGILQDEAAALSAREKYLKKALSAANDLKTSRGGVLMGEAISAWAESELQLISRRTRYFSSSRLVNGPSVVCTSRVSQVLLNIAMACFLGFIVAIVLVLWREIWSVAKTEIV